MIQIPIPRAQRDAQLFELLSYRPPQPPALFQHATYARLVRPPMKTSP